MPKIIIRTDAPGHEARFITLSERLVADNLESSHYAAQLIERISWAVEDAEVLEAHAAGAQAPPAGAGRPQVLDAASDGQRSTPAVSLTQ